MTMTTMITADNTTSSALRRLGLLTLLVAAGYLLLGAIGAAKASAVWQIEDFDGSVLQQNGEPATQAASHPWSATTGFEFTTQFVNGQEFPTENFKDITVDLPPGLIGNPQAVPTCTEAELQEGFEGACPIESQVGFSRLLFGEGFNGPGSPRFAFQLPVYNIEAPDDAPAQFGFNLLGVVVHITGRVRTGEDYGISTDIGNSSQGLPVLGTSLTFWGIPADPGLDGVRGTCTDFEGVPTGNLCPSSAPRKAFLTNPTSCAGPQETKLFATSWQGSEDTATFLSHDNEMPPNPIGGDGCENVPFDPSISVEPTSPRADSPSGYDIEISIPQVDNPDAIASAHLKKAEVTLPEGVSVSPSAADGLGACSQAQIGLDTPDDPTCPDNSKIGNVEIDTPLMDEPMQGSIYLADPEDNAFNELLAIYLVAKRQGVLLKLPGVIEADPVTGQLTTTFDNQPQLPFRSLSLSFKGGPRAPLTNPPACGTYQVESQITGWAGNPPSTPGDSFQITAGPDGGACPPNPQPFNPGFEAGSQHPLAGEYSPFILRMTRADGDQELDSIQAHLPPGVTAKLRGVPECPSAAANAGACSAASMVGRVNVRSGAGSNPYFLPGSVYLTEGYKGAPLGLLFKVPAVAGPFDLGDVLVRTAVFVDKDDAQLHVYSDPIPRILEGIPLRLRLISVITDRPGFTRNPSNCSPMTVNAAIKGGGGATANRSNRFQVGGCAGLAFAPKFTARVNNNSRGRNPRLVTRLVARPGDANVKRVVFRFPRSIAVDQRHTTNLCTEAQLAANECAGRRVFGSVVATTPLLDQPLRGPLYLVSGGGGLPRLAMVLHGQVNLVVRGRTEGTRRGGYRTVIPLAPDTAINAFTLKVNGGRNGVIVNTRNQCKPRKSVGSVTMNAHNGRRLTRKVRLGHPRCGKRKRRRR